MSERRSPVCPAAEAEAERPGLHPALAAFHSLSSADLFGPVPPAPGPPPFLAPFLGPAQRAVDATRAALERLHARLAPEPWWALVVGSTVAFRVALAPLVVVQQRAIARSWRLRPVLDAAAASFRARATREARGPIDAMERKWQAEFKAHSRQLQRKHGCLARYLILPQLAQAPFFAVLSMTWRSMAGYPVLWSTAKTAPADGFSGGGALWFTDLSVPDPTSVLPLAIGAVHLSNVQLSTYLQDNKQQHSKVVYAMRAFALFAVVMAQYLPTATTLYWFTSATFSLFQCAILYLPPVRRWLGFPLQRGLPKMTLPPSAAIRAQRPTATQL